MEFSLFQRSSRTSEKAFITNKRFRNRFKFGTRRAEKRSTYEPKVFQITRTNIFSSFQYIIEHFYKLYLISTNFYVDVVMACTYDDGQKSTKKKLSNAFWFLIWDSEAVRTLFMVIKQLNTSGRQLGQQRMGDTFYWFVCWSQWRLWTNSAIKCNKIKENLNENFSYKSRTITKHFKSKKID